MSGGRNVTKEGENSQSSVFTKIRKVVFRRRCTAKMNIGLSCHLRIFHPAFYVFFFQVADFVKMCSSLFMQPSRTPSIFTLNFLVFFIHAFLFL
jgi:hypothetical protein